MTETLELFPDDDQLDLDPPTTAQLRADYGRAERQLERAKQAVAFCPDHDLDALEEQICGMEVELDTAWGALAQAEKSEAGAR